MIGWLLNVLSRIFTGIRTSPAVDSVAGFITIGTFSSKPQFQEKSLIHNSIYIKKKTHMKYIYTGLQAHLIKIKSSIVNNNLE